MTNEEISQRACEESKLRGLSPYTMDSYLKALTLFIRYYEDHPIAGMGEAEIRAFLYHQLNSGKASGTVNVYNSALRFIFGAVLEQNLNYRLIPRRRHYRDFPAIMSKAEIAHFFSAIDNLRDRAIFETVYGAGLRLSEIAHLRVLEIDSKQMRIFVHHGKGGKDRYTLLSQRNLEVLRQYWKEYRPNHPDGFLFYPRTEKNKVLAIRSVQNVFYKYRKKAELPTTATIHTLRHSCASLLLAQGVSMKEIQDWLGHSTFNTAADIYAHLDFGSKQASANAIATAFEQQVSKTFLSS